MSGGDPVSGTIQAGIDLGTAVIGATQQAQARAAQERNMMRLMSYYQSMGTPVLSRLTPDLAAPSAEAGVATDPALQLQQMESMRQLSDEASTGGQTPADRAAMALATNEANQQSVAKQRALQNLLQARGLGSSSAAMALQSSGVREGANQAANAGMQAQVAARQRALQSARDSGALAGSVRAQQFSERDRTAAARDQWARYNADATRSANRYNAGLAQQDWDNKFRQADSVAGISRAAADQHVANVATGTQQVAGIGHGIGEAAGGIYGAASGGQAAPADPYSNTNYNPYPSAPTKLPDEDKYRQG